jgi:hypothetical protein
MQLMIRVINAFVAVGAIVLIMMSMWPGFVIGCFLVLALPLIALLGIAWLIVAVGALRQSGRPSKPHLARQLMLAPLLVCLTYGVLKFYVPRRIAFLAVRTRFDSFVASAPVSDYGSKKLDRWIGIYHVDEYAADPRGGVYFRTGSGPDGIGPDMMSYGFVYRPNPQGTPFGATRLEIRRITQDWCWFQTSDD